MVETFQDRIKSQFGVDLDRVEPRDMDYARQYTIPGEDRVRRLRSPNWDKLRGRMRNIDIKRRAERGRRFISDR